MGSLVVGLAECLKTNRGVVITFDDGFTDTLTAAAPILTSLKMPFTVFVSPKFITSGSPEFMSADQLCELSKMPGVMIGAHGLTHRRLTECDDADLANELSRSKEHLETLIGKEVTTMSYPHGAVNDRVRQAVSRAGFKIAACSDFGALSRNPDPLLLPRTDIWSLDNVDTFSQKILGCWDWLRVYQKYFN